MVSKEYFMFGCTLGARITHAPEILHMRWIWVASNIIQPPPWLSNLEANPIREAINHHWCATSFHGKDGTTPHEGFHTWWYPEMDGLFHGKCHLWMDNHWRYLSVKRSWSGTHWWCWSCPPWQEMTPWTTPWVTQLFRECYMLKMDGFVIAMLDWQRVCVCIYNT